jgi:membrane-associated phospholipid phosphatase
MLVGVSVLYVDRPVARFVFEHRSAMLFFEALASPSLLSLPFAGCYLVYYALCRVTGRPAGRHAEPLLTLALAITLATAAKDELKWLIGRPWPITWVRYGIYAPHPFRADYLFGSFPSGHTTYIAAPMFVLWWLLPQYRALWAALVLMVMIGLVGSGYHFVADVIAGLFLGLAVAAGTVAARQPIPEISRRSPRFP